jgi:hypothetical protein
MSKHKFHFETEGVPYYEFRIPRHEITPHRIRT